MAAPAARSASQSGSSPTTRARLARMVLVALRRFRRSWGSARATLAALGKSGSLVAIYNSPLLLLGARQDLGQMGGADSGAQTAECSADVHQAGGVRRR